MKLPSVFHKLDFTTLFTVAAIVISIVSFYFSDKAQQDVARIDVVKTEYGLFHDLASLQMQYPLMEHLLTPTDETYDLTVAQIERAVSADSKQSLPTLQLQERALAHYIFTSYEETYYIWQQARTAGDKRREQLASEDLVYFDEAICSNPRMLWYWDYKGGKLDRAFSDDLQTYYKEHVLKDCPTQEDSRGPFYVATPGGTPK